MAHHDSISRRPPAILELLGIVLFALVCYLAGRADGEVTQIQRCNATVQAQR